MTVDDPIFSAVDGVVFDFGGVMTVSPLADWELYRFCERFGIGRDKVRKAFDDYRHLWDGGFITFEEMYRRTFADWSLPPPDEALLAELWHVDPESWVATLREDTLELMKALKGRGFKLGLLTNMSDDFYSRLFVPRLAAYRSLLDVETVSSHVRMYKPQREIYDLAASRMGMAPSRLLFLDDTPANVEAARSFGWHSEVYV